MCVSDLQHFSLGMPCLQNSYDSCLENISSFQTQTTLTTFQFMCACRWSCSNPSCSPKTINRLNHSDVKDFWLWVAVYCCECVWISTHQRKRIRGWWSHNFTQCKCGMTGRDTMEKHFHSASHQGLSLLPTNRVRKETKCVLFPLERSCLFPRFSSIKMI